jgi:hypothetical protein
VTPERIAKLREELEWYPRLDSGDIVCPDSVVAELLAEVDRLKAECDEWQLSFDLFESAVHRGTEMWREANPGNELVLPSTDKLVVWLIHTLDQQRRVVEAARMMAEVLRDPPPIVKIRGPAIEFHRRLIVLRAVLDESAGES